MRYPIAIETGTETTAYGVAVPDIPGCFSAGDTLDEALTNAEEAILFMLEDYVERGEAFPVPTELDKLMRTKDYKGWAWFVVNVDTSKLSGKSVRLNITLPERLVPQIDDYAAKHGESRSGFLARAAVQAMAG